MTRESPPRTPFNPWSWTFHERATWALDHVMMDCFWEGTTAREFLAQCLSQTFMGRSWDSVETYLIVAFHDPLVRAGMTPPMYVGHAGSPEHKQAHLELWMLITEMIREAISPRHVRTRQTGDQS